MIVKKGWGSSNWTSPGVTVDKMKVYPSGTLCAHYSTKGCNHGKKKAYRKAFWAIRNTDILMNLDIDRVKSFVEK